MTSMICRRLLWSLVTLWAVVTISFWLMRIAPGGPFDSDKPLPAAVEANLKRTFGLAADVLAPVSGTVVELRVVAGQSWRAGEAVAVIRSGTERLDVTVANAGKAVRTVVKKGAQVMEGAPLLVRETTLWEQYSAALTSYARGDFGVTYASEGARTVMQNVTAGFAVSLELGLYALFVALIFGVGSGLVAGMYHKTWIDHAAMASALIAVSLSTIVIGPLLVLVLCVQLQWLPWGGWQPWSWTGGDGLVKILPSLTLGLVYAAWFSRLVRAGLLEVTQQPWMQTARAKGLSERRVIFVHALKPALLPALSYLGPALAGIVTGSVVIERIFAIPGIGEHFVSAALNRDYPMVMGTVVLYAALLIAANLAVDIAQAWLDPRVRTRVFDG